MSTGSIHLTSIAVLDLAGGSLGRYRAEMEECLRVSEAATRSAHQRLMVRERDTERSIASLEDELDSARNQDEPDYSDVYRIQSALEDAHNRLRTIRMHLSSVEERIREFSRQHRAMSAYLGHDLPKSLMLLSQIRAHVERYGSSSGPGSFGGSSGSGWSSVNLLPTPVQLPMESKNISEQWLLHRGATFASTTISSEATAVINEYKGPFTYGPFNHWSRYGPSDNHNYYIAEQKAMWLRKHLDQGFGRFQLSSPITVYRGLHHAPDVAGIIDQYRDATAGSSITDKAFISTSASKQTASEFAFNGVLLSLYVPRGATYIPMSRPDDFQREAELLFPRGSTFFFTDAPGNIREVILLPPGTTAPGVGVDTRAYAQAGWIDFVDKYPTILAGAD